MEKIEKIKKPDWIRAKVPAGETWRHVEETLGKYQLHTVCDAAQCPNKGECWGAGTATFMILGDVCTRNCRFCAVETARQGRPVRPDEAQAIAQAARDLGLTYLVLTSVDRDDLPDRGAGQFRDCVRAVKLALPNSGVEALIPDYQDDEIALLAEARPDVAAHNIETVPRLQGIRDHRASFAASLATLKAAKKRGLITKSSLLLGLGEKSAEVLETMDALRDAEVDILVLGQYLQPTKRQIPVAEYLTPEQFDAYQHAALSRGFRSVIAAPLARTSYHAVNVFKEIKKFKRIKKISAQGKPDGCKVIGIEAEVAEGRIEAIRIWGDFFATPEDGFDAAVSRLRNLSPDAVADTFDRLITEAGVTVFGISGRGVESVVFSALNGL